MVFLDRQASGGTVDGGRQRRRCDDDNRCWLSSLFLPFFKSLLAISFRSSKLLYGNRLGFFFLFIENFVSVGGSSKWFSFGESLFHGCAYFVWGISVL